MAVLQPNDTVTAQSLTTVLSVNLMNYFYFIVSKHMAALALFLLQKYTWEQLLLASSLFDSRGPKESKSSEVT